MLVRKNCLVVAIEGSRMALFRNVGNAYSPDLEVVEDHKNLSEKTSDIGSDKPGRSSQSGTKRRPTHEQTDFHQLEEDRFVQDAASRIDDMVAMAKDGVVLVAAPHAMGVLRKHIKPVTDQKLMAQIPKAFGPEDAEPLAKMLVNHQA